MNTMKPVETEPGHNGNLYLVVKVYSSEDPEFNICVGRKLLPTEENFSSLQFRLRRDSLCLKHCVFCYARNQLGGHSFRNVTCVLQL